MALPLLATLLVAGLGYLLWSQGPDEGPQLLERDGLEEGGKGTPVLKGSGPAEREGAESEPSGRDPADVDDETPRHLVMGRVEGLSAAERSETAVRVLLLREHDWVLQGVEPEAGSLAEDGSFAIDIHALRSEHPKSLRIRVEVDHPDHLVHKSLLALAPLADPGTRLKEPVTLTRAHVVTGSILLQGGAPAPGAKVALYALEGSELALTEMYDAREIDRSTTDVEGAFRLRARDPGVVLLAANAEGHVPRALRVTIPRSEAPAPVSLELSAGHDIVGRVTLNGEPVVASIRASPQTESSTTDLQWVNADWADGALLHDPGVVRSEAATGAFRLTSLDRTPRDLAILRVQGYFMRKRTIGWSSTEVTAPAEGVEIALTAAILDVRVVAGNEPVKNVRIGIRKASANWHSAQSSPEGELKILLPPDQALIVTVEHDAYDKVERRIEPLGAGGTTREVIDLGPAKATSSLRVKLRGEDDKPVTSCGFLITRNVTGHIAMGFDSGLGLKTSATGDYVLEDLQPGPWKLLVTPGRAPDDVSTGKYLVFTDDVTFIEGREQLLELTAVLGARISLTVKDATGAVTSAYATLRDGRGEEVPTSWYWSSETSASMSSSGPGAAASTAVPALPAGSYEIEVSAEGHQSKRIQFSVTKGQTKQLEVTLEKE